MSDLAVRKGEDVMSTITGNLRRTMLLGVVGTLVIAGAVRLARADVASDKPGAILVFPKIVVDTSGLLGPPTDTEIQITNTSGSVISAHCYLVNSNSHCSNSLSTVCTAAGVAGGAPAGRGGCPTGGTCLGPCSSGLQETNFRMTLTKRQPVSWKASEGLGSLPCDPVSNPGNPSGCLGGSNVGSDGSPSSVPPVKEDPFVGEIKCIEVDPTTFAPSAGFDPTNGFAGDLKGEATIVSASDTSVDARKYNAIGIQSLGAGTNNGDDTLAVGGSTPEYNGCPKQLIVDNFFDGAPVTTHGGASTRSVTTDLTFVPCTEDFANQSPSAATLQFLVYNEFEQRFSTSMGLSCFKEVQLSDIDTRPGSFGNLQSIFSFAVQGTFSGQTKIRPVAGATTDNRVLAVSEEFWECASAPGSCSNDHDLCNSDSDCGTGNICVKNCSAAANVNLVPGTGNGDLVTVGP